MLLEDFLKKLNNKVNIALLSFDNKWQLLCDEYENKSCIKGDYLKREVAESYLETDGVMEVWLY